MYVTEQTRFKCFDTALHSYSTYAKSSSFNDAMLYVHSDVSTVGVWAGHRLGHCLYVCLRAEGGMTAACYGV